MLSVKGLVEILKISCSLTRWLICIVLWSRMMKELVLMTTSFCAN